jgi:hypothetical protein
MVGGTIGGQPAALARLRLVEPHVSLFGPHDPSGRDSGFGSGRRRGVPDAGQLRKGRRPPLHPNLDHVTVVEARQDDDRQPGHQRRHRGRHEFSPPQHPTSLSDALILAETTA